MSFIKGTWRLDLILMVLYQLTLFFSVQLLFTIFLDYMPTTYCNEDNFCYKMKSKCLTNYDYSKPNLCANNQTESEFQTCVKEHKKIDFRSAQLQYQYDCTDLRNFTPTTATFIGTLVGNIILGFLSDKFGRRPIFFLSLAIGIPSIILAAAIPGIKYFYIFRGITGFAVAGTLTVGWTYGSEMISPPRRFRLRTFPNWANARMMQVGVAFIAGEWRITSYICAIISCGVIPLLWYLPESPVFLEQKKSYKRANKAREKMAKICQIEYKKPARNEQPVLKKITLWKLLRTPTLRTSFFILCFMWFYNGMTIYITDLNGGDMTKNFYVGQFLSGLLLTISKIIIGLLEPKFDWLGRRVIFLGAQIVALAAYLAILIALYTDNKGSMWYSFVYMLAYTSQSLCLETCYLSLAELMPTNVRNTAGSITNILMKIGTILASTAKPLKFAYEPALFLINITICSVGAVLVYLYLKESKNVNLQMVGQEDVDDDDPETQTKSRLDETTTAEDDQKTVSSETLNEAMIEEPSSLESGDLVKSTKKPEEAPKKPEEIKVFDTEKIDSELESMKLTEPSSREGDAAKKA